MSSILRKYFIKNESPQTRWYIKRNEQNQPGRTFAKSIILQPINQSEYIKQNNSHSRSVDKTRVHTMPANIIENKNDEDSNKCSRLDVDLGRRKKSKNKYQIFPIKKLQPIRLMKRPSSSSLNASYLKMASSRTKPTDKLFSEKDNIRLVQRLLMAKPTKGYQKDEHNKFYNEQKHYKKNIQISKSLPFKYIKQKKPWLDF